MKENPGFYARLITTLFHCFWYWCLFIVFTAKNTFKSWSLLPGSCQTVQFFTANMQPRGNKIIGAPWAFWKGTCWSMTGSLLRHLWYYPAVAHQRKWRASGSREDGTNILIVIPNSSRKRWTRLSATHARIPFHRPHDSACRMTLWFVYSIISSCPWKHVCRVAIRWGLPLVYPSRFTGITRDLYNVQCWTKSTKLWQHAVPDYTHMLYQQGEESLSVYISWLRG